MEQQAFALIVQKVGEVLSVQGFAKSGEEQEEKGRSALFTGENAAYSILYNAAQKRFELRVCTMTDDGPDDKWKSVSMWLFDPEVDDLSQAESIVNDFVETVQGPKRISAVQNIKKRHKDEDNNSDPLFFFNRLVGVFPDMKDALAEERVRYGDVRPVSFARAAVLPRMESLLSRGGKTEQAEKLGGVLNDMYAAGDMDVRSIITIVLLNGLKSEVAVRAVAEHLDEGLLKAYKSGVKLRGKKVKPEKVKKQSRFVAEALKNTQGK